MAAVLPTRAAPDVPTTIRLTSPAFSDGELLAQRYTCDGTNASPPLEWSGVPDGTGEVVVVCEDREAPDGGFVHWMVADLGPTSLGALEEDHLPEGATVGINDFGDAAYGGPCPPQEGPPRRYVFTVLAAGVTLGLEHRFTAAELAAELEDEVLATGELAARYGRRALSGPNPPTPSG